MEPSIARDNTSSTNTSRISHGNLVGPRICFDVHIQNAQLKKTNQKKQQVLEIDNCTALNGLIPLISAVNTAAVFFLLSGYNGRVWAILLCLTGAAQ